MTLINRRIRVTEAPFNPALNGCTGTVVAEPVEGARPRTDANCYVALLDRDYWAEEEFLQSCVDCGPDDRVPELTARHVFLEADQFEVTSC